MENLDKHVKTATWRTVTTLIFNKNTTPKPTNVLRLKTVFQLKNDENFNDESLNKFQGRRVRGFFGKELPRRELA